MTEEDWGSHGAHRGLFPRRATKFNSDTSCGGWDIASLPVFRSPPRLQMNSMQHGLITKHVCQIWCQYWKVFEILPYSLLDCVMCGSRSWWWDPDDVMTGRYLSVRSWSVPSRMMLDRSKSHHRICPHFLFGSDLFLFCKRDPYLNTICRKMFKENEKW